MQFPADTVSSPQVSSSAGHVHRPDAEALHGRRRRSDCSTTAPRQRGTKRIRTLRDAERARTEIERLNARVRELAAELVQVRDAERSRFARELHDGLGAQLTVSRYALARLETWLPLNAPEACQEALVTANAALDALCETSHRLVEEGHAPAKGTGLVTLLTDWISEFGQATRLDTSFEWIADAIVMRERLTQLQDDGANTVYRIVQEALNNAAKHAAARSVEVKLVAERRVLSLTIKDDGRGIARGGARESKPVRFVGDARALRGARRDIEDQFAAGQGTQIRAQLPWNRLCAPLGAR
ncbi:MAG: ATP-binding protein [Pararobbsia sp.]